MQLTSFKAKVIKSVMLSVAMFIAKFGLQLVSIVVLARLLSPEIYGVFAVVLVFIYLLEMFSDMGLRSLILTREGEVSPEFLQTCWTLQIVRGGVIFGAVIVIALIIAALQGWGIVNPDSAYSAPVLPWALVGVAASILLGAFGPTTPYIYERDMKFGHVTLSLTVSSAIGLFVTIGIALVNPTIWALVIGTAFQRLALVLYGYLVFKGVPMRFRWDKEALGVAVDRGKWLWGHSVLSAATNSADRLLFGVVMDSSTFGFYFIATRIVGFCANFLRLVDTRMGLQVFTHILKHNTKQFQHSYYRFRMLFDVLAGTGAGMLFVLAPLIVDVVFDDRYSEVAPIIQVLSLGLMLAGPLILRSAFSAERQFKTMTLLSMVTAGTIWVGLLVSLFVFESIEAALLVIVFFRLPEAFLLFWRSAKRGWLLPIREVMPLMFFAVGYILGQGVLWGVDTFS